MSEERDAIEDIYEPFLIQIGFLDRTPRGRVATAAGLRVFRAARPGKGSSVVKALRRVKIAGLSTYVPPRVLTNDDLEKLVDTSNEWILQRTGIRRTAHRRTGRRHVGSGGGGGGRRPAAGRGHAGPDRLHRRRDDDAGHDLPEHRVPAAAQDRRAPRVGVRSRRRVLGVHLRAGDRDADGRDRRRTTTCWSSAPT